MTICCITTPASFHIDLLVLCCSFIHRCCHNEKCQLISVWTSISLLPSSLSQLVYKIDLLYRFFLIFALTRVSLWFSLLSYFLVLCGIWTYSEPYNSFRREKKKSFFTINFTQNFTSGTALPCQSHWNIPNVSTDIGTHCCRYCCNDLAAVSARTMTINYVLSRQRFVVAKHCDYLSVQPV